MLLTADQDDAAPFRRDEPAAATAMVSAGDPAARGIETRSSRLRVGGLALAALVALWGGWAFRDQLLPSARPALALLGIVAPAKDDAATSGIAAQDDEAKPANFVTVDDEGKKRLGLAFGQAETRRLIRPVRAPGTVAFDERRVTHLKPRTLGRVLSLTVQPGDRVGAGQTLATLDAAGILDARNGLAAAQAALGEAQATEKVAELNLKRGTDLVRVGGIAQAEVDRRQVDLAKARASVQSAQAQAEMFRAQYERLAPTGAATSGTSAIVTPIAGVVTSAHITLGEVVDTNRDAFTVADPSRILVLANLYGHDIDGVKSGDLAKIDAPITAHPRFEGRVQSVNAALDAATGTAPARIEIDNPDGLLRANMFVSVSIDADLGREGVTIPAGAVQQTESGPIAFVRTAENRFEKRDLGLGLQRSDWVEVTSGLAAGETVATDGSFGLKAILLRGLLGSTN